MASSPLRLHLTRSLTLPDPLRLARYRRAPELGPRILFFSGGSALNPLCRELINYTHNSIHIITAFDSGGSSAELRKAFRMPAVGDVRNRLMALADQTVQGNPDVVRLFSFRFSAQAPQEQLASALQKMVAGHHPLVAAVRDPMRKIIRNHLGYVWQALPPKFDLHGASIGNLVLTGGYLNNNRHLDPVIFLFSKLAEVRGVVRPVVNDHLHLAAELEGDKVVVGQHLLTGREAPPLQAPICKLYLTRSIRQPRPVRVAVRDKLMRLIAQAELICFPMGSFYTSLLANLLPAGVCQAVAQADCPKLFIPNPAGDPEQIGLDVAGSAQLLLEYLRHGCTGGVPSERLLNLVLLDSQVKYSGGAPDKAALASLGLEVLDAPLVTEQSAPGFDPGLLASMVLSLV